MANYKTADKLPILEEVTENTYALVEDGGALKRVPGSMLGGSAGSGNVCVITEHMVDGNSDNSTYTCNMTYDELRTALENRTLSGFNIIVYYAIFFGVYIFNELRLDGDIIQITWRRPYSDNIYGVYYCPDDTITTNFPESEPV